MTQKTSSVIAQQILVLLATIGTIGINALANTIPLNGYTTGAVSNSIPMFFVPAGYVFLIWSLIYVSLIAFSIYQILPAQRINNKQFMMIRLWYVLSCLANGVWIVLWHYLYIGYSVLAMLILLGSLIFVYFNIKQKNNNRVIKNRAERWLLAAPFSLYLGWITVATIANISAALTFYHWDGFGLSGELWTAIMLAIATVITVSNITKHRDIIYGLVIIWAFIGIVVKFPNIIMVAYTAAAMIVIMLITLFRTAIHHRPLQ